MNYRERYEMRREEGKRRRKRNARASIVTLLVSATIVIVVWFVAGRGRTKTDVVSEVSSAPAVVSSQSAVPPVSTEWNLILVNDGNLLPLDYTLPGLAEVSAGQEVDARIADMTQKMIADAKSAGVTIQICSAYRTVPHQQRLYEREPPKQPGEPASVQAPRASEHHTGLAIDVNCPEFTALEEGFENTAAFRWLDEHAHEYGYILRYPKDKISVTGVIYEPWHYRYVGIDHAKAIKERKICLEEYLQSR